MGQRSLERSDEGYLMKVEILIYADVVINDDETADEVKEQITNELPDIFKDVQRLSDYLINVDGELCIESEGHYEHVDGPAEDSK